MRPHAGRLILALTLLGSLPAAAGQASEEPTRFSMIGEGCAPDGILRAERILPSLRPCAVEVAADGSISLVSAAGAATTMPSETTQGGWTEFARTWPHRRMNASMAYLPTAEMVVLYGGMACPGYTSCGPQGDTWTWDGSWWTRVQPALSPPPLHAAAMTYDAAREELVLFGGQTCVDTDCSLSSETWTFDGTTWEKQAPLVSPPASSASAMAYDPGSARVVLSGGCAQDRCPGLVGTWTWDGTTWELEDLLTPLPRYGAVAATDPDQGVVLFGGADVSGSSLGETWRWSGSTWTKLEPATSPPSRLLAGIVLDTSSDEVVVFAGSSSTCTLSCVGGYRSDMWIWDGETWTERTSATPARGGQGVTLAYDAARDAVVRFGGIGTFANAVGAPTTAHEVNTWLWDGERWTERLSTVPEERVHGAMGFHPEAGVNVLAGGYCVYTSTCDTWTWDGLAWKRLPDAPAPGPISRRALVPRQRTGSLLVALNDGVWSLDYDQHHDRWTWAAEPGGTLPQASNGLASGVDRHERLILFGAQICDSIPCSYSDRTWMWDGGSWSERSPASGTPPGRAFASMAADPGDQRTVMFGGLSQGGTVYYGDTWIWDGDAWTEGPAAGPPSRAFAPIAADPASGGVMVLGGLAGTPNHPVLGDQWLFDGQSWTQIDPAGGPVHRIEFAIAGYPPGPATLLFGGQDENPGYPMSDTWVWSGP